MERRLYIRINFGGGKFHICDEHDYGLYMPIFLFDISALFITYDGISEIMTRSWLERINLTVANFIMEIYDEDVENNYYKALKKPAEALLGSGFAEC